MSRDATTYKDLLARLLPEGLDWLRLDPRVARLVAGLGRVFKRSDDVVETFTQDSVADRSTGERLAGWETTLQLPDPDYPEVDPENVAARQAEVKRALSQGGRPTPPLYVALAAVWQVVATVWEPTSWPWHFWMVGPPEHVHVARFGSAHFGDTFVTRSTTWERVMRLVARYKPSRMKLHDVDLLEV